jgi:hypothetical protein
VWPPRSGETSRLGSMDPVAKRDQVQAAWWQEKQGEVGYGFLVEPQNQGGGQVMSGIGVEAAPSPRGLRRFTKKPSGLLVEPQSQDQRLGGRRRDLGASRDFEAKYTCRDRKACVKAKRVAVAGHLSDGATTRIPKVPFGGVYPSIM